MKDTPTEGGAGTGEVWTLVLAVLGILGNWKMFQTLGEKLQNYLFERFARPHNLTARLSDEQLKVLLTHEHEEIDTMAMLIQAELKADRITIVEYDCPTDTSKPTLATCILEHRSPRISSVKYVIQQQPLEPEVWQEVLRVHSLPSRCLFIPDVRKLENSALRSRLLRTGVFSAYYQALPATAGHCAAMLSLSWTTPVELSPLDLAGLHLSGRTIAALQRTLWMLKPVAA